MSAQPLSLREEEELRLSAAQAPMGVTRADFDRLLATLDEERREREAALTALRAEEQRNALLTAKCDGLHRALSGLVGCLAADPQMSGELRRVRVRHQEHAAVALREACELVVRLDRSGDETASPATVQQPAPTVNDSPEVWPEVEAFVRERTSPQLQADLLARRNMGAAKYGVALQRDNGRSALVDAYQEAQDLLFYLVQAWMRESQGTRASRRLREAIYKHISMCQSLCAEVHAEQAVPR